MRYLKIPQCFFCVGLILIKIGFANTHHPEAFLNQIRGTKDEGKQIVSHFCANCHAIKPMIPLGAPKAGVAIDWEVRVKQGKALLFKHTDEGLNAMPPRGGCFECSDEQLWMAIMAMIPTPLAYQLLSSQKAHKKTIKKK